MRLTIELDTRLYAIINEHAAKWDCTKATAARTLIYDGINANARKNNS